MRRTQRLSLVVAAAAVLFAVGDLVLLPRSVVSIAPPTAAQFLKAMAALGFIYLAMRVVKRRMDDKPARIAVFISNAAAGMMIIIRAAALFTPLSLAAGIFMYVAAATALPLRDAELADIDRAIGFVWPSFLAATNAVPILARALSFAYHTTGPQIPALF